MNVNGVAASLNFPSFAGIDGGLFIGSPDKAQALVHMRAYNDWHIDEWCGAHPGRFIPLGCLPLWDPRGDREAKCAGSRTRAATRSP